MKDILGWLETEKKTRMTLDGLNYWKRKMRSVRPKKRVLRRRKKASSRVRGTLLRLRLDKDVEKAIQLLLQTVQTSHAFTTLAVLRQLNARASEIDDQKSSAGDNGAIANVASIAEEAGCSVATLYAVAARFKAAGSNWNRFVETAFSKAGTREIGGLLELFRSKGYLPAPQ